MEKLQEVFDEDSDTLEYTRRLWKCALRALAREPLEMFPVIWHMVRDRMIVIPWIESTFIDGLPADKQDYILKHLTPWVPGIIMFSKHEHLAVRCLSARNPGNESLYWPWVARIISMSNDQRFNPQNLFHKRLLLLDEFARKTFLQTSPWYDTVQLHSKMMMMRENQGMLFSKDKAMSLFKKMTAIHTGHFNVPFAVTEFILSSLCFGGYRESDIVFLSRNVDVLVKGNRGLAYAEYLVKNQKDLTWISYYPRTYARFVRDIVLYAIEHDILGTDASNENREERRRSLNVLLQRLNAIA